MKLTCSLLAFAFTACLVSARDSLTNNLPPTRLETFESSTGTVIIKGTDDLGVVVGKSGGVIVKLRESRDVSTNRREFGVLVSVRENDQDEDTTVIDYDELEMFLKGLDYISKVDFSATSLGHFEAGYTTRSGLRATTYSSRRTSNFEAVIVSNRLLRCRCPIAMTQLAEFRNIIEQAKTRIEQLQKGK
jgi:hypothetical protein